MPAQRSWIGLLGIVCLLILTNAPAARSGDTLVDVLREKGVITKEDWVRIQAAKEKEEADEREKLKKDFPVKVGWGKKGFTLETLDGKWKTALQWRFQGRWTYPERSDPRNAAAFSDNPESTFELRRVRMKIGGHGFRPWIKYYFEVDLQPGRDFDDDSEKASTRLIDWRIMIERFKWLQLRIGQWKVNYNRERVDSSGKQQFVERSIVNRIFTIDRQIGAMVYGHLFPGTMVDSRYYVGVFTGAGRGLEKNDDANMMWMGRFQWNFLGRDLKFSQSDVKYHTQPAGSLAVGVYTTIGKCTRWSSSGCGNLAGFTKPSAAADGQFRVEGIVEEAAFKWRGFSFQHEFHWKQIKDNTIAEGAPGHRTNLFGSYTQAGYFFHYLIP
ncbi:MAG: porin, partial [Nitrospirae bacterium]